MFRFRDEVNCRLVFVLRQMAIDTVITRIDLAAGEPLPKGRMAGGECHIPSLAPVEEVGVSLKHSGNLSRLKSVEDGRGCQVGSIDK